MSGQGPLADEVFIPGNLVTGIYAQTRASGSLRRSLANPIGRKLPFMCPGRVRKTPVNGISKLPTLSIALNIPRFPVASIAVCWTDFRITSFHGRLLMT